jgi:ATP-binding cassette subfamily D (ALD) protein 3
MGGTAQSKLKANLAPQKRGWALTAICAVSLASGMAYKQRQLARERADPNFSKNDSKKEKSRGGDRATVNGAFFKKLRILLAIMIPGLFTSEFGFMILTAITMVVRTFCDVWMIKNGTAIESAIIGRDSRAFKHYVLKFVSLMLPISVVNSLLKYSLNELHLRFRTRLTNHLFKEYLAGFTYYKISNIDNRISNADQLLTQDVDKFCQSVADLYSNISKPILDIFIYAVKLTGAIGAQGPGSMLAYLAFSGVFLTVLRKPISRYTVSEQRLEGEFRYVNSRLITNAEEVAFYDGNRREKIVIDSSFRRLVDHLRKSMQFRFTMGVVDNMVAKYWATVVGYTAVSRPFLDLTHPRHENSTHSEIMEDYYKSGRMLLNLSMAVGRLVLAGRELTRLAGFTQRVTDLISVLKDLNSGKYVRTMVSSSDNEVPLAPGSGTVIEADRLIRFESVPIVTPNGDVLIKALSLEVKSGMNVLVSGPNGCGKSSLFRILGGLWPLFGGTLVKPSRGKLFYVPQRPYMTLGTLRDQVIYPHTFVEYQSKGMKDDQLLEFLKKVHLEYLVDREGGWDSVQDWMDVLSGGEKQRIAMARLFYHQPQFAILDECTSAVSVDVEGFMYTHCRELGITLFTVSHRKTLWKYHEYVLKFDGRGSYSFEPMDVLPKADE